MLTDTFSRWLPAAGGTVQMIVLAVSLVIGQAALPTRTDVAPERLLPEMVKELPAEPKASEPLAGVPSSLMVVTLGPTKV